MVLPPGYRREARVRQLIGVARAGTLKFARAGPTGINMPAADLSERARSHAHNQPAVMTVKLIFSSIALTELTSFPDLGWPELPARGGAPSTGSGVPAFRKSGKKRLRICLGECVVAVLGESHHVGELGHVPTACCFRWCHGGGFRGIRAC